MTVASSEIRRIKVSPTMTECVRVMSRFAFPTCAASGSMNSCLVSLISIASKRMEFPFSIALTDVCSDFGVCRPEKFIDGVLVARFDCGSGVISWEPELENLFAGHVWGSGLGIPKLDPQSYLALTKLQGTSSAIAYRLHQHLFDIRTMWKCVINGIRPEQHNVFFPHETCHGFNNFRTPSNNLL